MLQAHQFQKELQQIAADTYDFVNAYALQQNVLILPLRFYFKLYPNLFTAKNSWYRASEYGKFKIYNDSFELRNAIATVVAGELNIPATADNVEELATYGIALTECFYAFDEQKKEMGYYTTNLQILEQLQKSGKLECDLAKIEKHLFGGIIEKNLKAGEKKIYAVRLDASIVDGEIKFKAVVPKTAIQTDTHYIFTDSSIRTSYEIFDKILRIYTLRITVGEDGRSKTRIVTKRDDVIAKVYGKFPQYIQQLVANCKWGEKELVANRYYVPAIGASVYSAGVTNINLPLVDKIEVIQDADFKKVVDLSDVAVSLVGIKKAFILQAQQRNAIPRVGQYLEVTDNTYENVLAKVNSMYDTQIQTAWKELTQMGILDYSTFIKQPNPLTGLYQSVELPITVDKLKELLRVGAYRIVATSKDGKRTAIVTTSNKAILKEVLGDNYVAMYETASYRYRLAIDEVKVGTLTPKNAAIKYNTPTLVNTDDTQAYIQLLEDEINKNEGRSKSAFNPNVVTVRRLDATSAEKFYGQVNVKNIIMMSRIK